MAGGGLGLPHSPLLLAGWRMCPVGAGARHCAGLFTASGAKPGRDCVPAISKPLEGILRGPPPWLRSHASSLTSLCWG